MASTTNYNIRQFDALVIGSGISGLVAARRLASKPGRSVAIITDGAGASPYVHGFNMPLHKDDSPELFLSDTESSGRGQSDHTLASELCGKATEMKPLLSSLGISFDRNADGSYSLLRPLGASVPRVASAGNHTGVAILNALNAELSANKAVHYLKNCRALRLFTEDGRVRGVLIADRGAACYTLCVADVTVLACGGFCNIFPFSTNSSDIGGDGVAMGYYAGAALTDMEFVQFEPSAAVHPDALRGKSVITTMYYEGAVLRNKDGERFMLKYSSDGECVNKDVQARCIFREIAEGRGTEHGGVFFDATGVGREKLDSLYPSYVQRYRDVGIDIATTPFEIAPAPHTSLGGVMINADCSVAALRGLFACGEVTGGIHGANRVGGNAGLETLVFGSIAGESAAAYADGFTHNDYDVSEAFVASLLSRTGNTPDAERLSEIRRDMQSLLSEELNVLRNAEGLGNTIARLSGMLEETRAYSTSGLNFASSLSILRLENDLTAALALAHSALTREGSCGCHVRTDGEGTPVCDGKYRTVIRRSESGEMVSARCAL